jgi:hypothetical protein
MKTTVRIAALMLLIVVSALPSNIDAQVIGPRCICPAVFDPHTDATGRTFSNGCFCQCLSTQPSTCKRSGNTAQ